MSKIILNGIEYSNGITYQELQPVIYSEEEREVGVWRDGKPLYQKTVNIGTVNPDNAWHNVPHGVSNIDKIVNVCGISASASGEYNFIPQMRATTTTGITLHVTTTNVRYVSNWFASSFVFVTIQYTKTTDTAGSGTWTPSGVPSVHYSTNEQVIGTWIDSKPLYEKTFNFTGTYSGDQGSLPINMSIADTIFPVDAWGINSANAICPFPYVHASANNNGGFFISADKNSIGLRFASGLTFKKVVITLRYTKTTD